MSQLDAIGIKVGHLPFRPPFSLTATHLTSTPTNVHTKRSSHKISKLDLLTSIKDREAFYALYVAITNRAIDMYAKAGRRKFALKLHGTLAALDLCVHFRCDLLVVSLHVNKAIADIWRLPFKPMLLYLLTMLRICGPRWNHLCYLTPLTPMPEYRSPRIGSGYTYCYHS